MSKINRARQMNQMCQMCQTQTNWMITNVILHIYNEIISIRFS